MGGREGEGEKEGRRNVKCITHEAIKGLSSLPCWEEGSLNVLQCDCNSRACIIFLKQYVCPVWSLWTIYV